MRIDVTGACDEDPVSVYLSEISAYRAIESDQADLYSRPDASTPNIVSSSICSANCSGPVQPLNPDLFYAVVTGNGVSQFCDTTRLSVEAFAPGSPGECSWVGVWHPRLCPASLSCFAALTTKNAGSQWHCLCMMPKIFLPPCKFLRYITGFLSCSSIR